MLKEMPVLGMFYCIGNALALGMERVNDVEQQCAFSYIIRARHYWFLNRWKIKHREDSATYMASNVVL